MSHLALYRAWRPMVFDEVVEQKHAVYALRQAVISGQIAHAYLFSGTRGTGKTTLAKIYSRAINCLHPDHGNPCNQCEICRGILDGSLLDVVEMDAASNNSVDNIRRICDEVIFMPSQARYKVYIIDEVHMLSTGAFNALLKTLEEPPAHAVFILATTEPHRIPATILSRCQRYEFRRIPIASLISRLEEIAQTDHIDIQPEALRTIALLADGAMRDAISLLDQARGGLSGTIGRDDILSLVGVVQDEFMQAVAEALHDADPARILMLVDQLVMAGRDIVRFVIDLAQFFRDLLVCRVSDHPEDLIHVTDETLIAMRNLSRSGQPAEWVAMIQGLSALLPDLRWAGDPRITLEIGLIRLMDQTQSANPTESKPAAVKTKTAIPDTGRSQEKQPFTQPEKKAGDENEENSRRSASVSEPVPQPVPGAMVDQPDPPSSTRSTDSERPTDSDDEPMPEPPPDDESEDPEITAYAADEPASADSLTAVPDEDENNMNHVRTDQPGSPDAAAPSEPAAEQPVHDAAAIWQAVSNRLQENGHMTLYLFSRPAKPVIRQQMLQLVFDQQSPVHYQEVSRPESVKILKDMLRQSGFQDLEIAPVLPETAQAEAVDDHSEPAWINQVITTADELGIPVKMED